MFFHRRKSYSGFAFELRDIETARHVVVREPLSVAAASDPAWKMSEGT